MQREKFSSRLGFLLISAGCAIGLGNVWRFPYVTGQYGGAAFVLIYLFFLILFGLPVMVIEFSVGRASQKSVAKSFDALEPKGSKWHLFKYIAVAGNYLLMMFYTTIGGWMLLYFIKMLKGDFEGLDVNGVDGVFRGITGNPLLMTVAMVIVVAVCFGVCSKGLQRGVEKVTKVMMVSLFAIMLVLVIRSVTLPGAGEGLRFYLYPRFDVLMEHGLPNAIFAAMGQAFFTLSVGMGSVAIFGSYIGKERTLSGEAISVTALDTGVALVAGLIIFPACFSFGINPGSGPELIFVTLPNVFNSMGGGRFWGSFFFIFMGFAAFSTIITVFENIISCFMDLTGWSRKKSVAVNFVLMILLSMPCVLGFNLWSGFQPFGGNSNILDLEDFIVSNNVLPIGTLVYVMFCTTRSGWGWDSFIEEANAGKGLRFPKRARLYMMVVLPVVILAVFVQGYLTKFMG